MTASPPSDARLDLIVERFVTSVARADARERARLIGEIDRMGAKEIHATAAVSQRLVASPLRVSTGRISLERALADVRAGVAASKRVRRLHRKAVDAIAELNDTADRLDQDTAEIVADHTVLNSQVGPLREYSGLAAKLDDALVAASAPDEVVFAARRRRVEIDTHLAVVLQGIAALALVELTYRELLVALRTASATAMAALRAARSAEEATGALDVVDRSELRRIAALQRAVGELKAATEVTATEAAPGGSLTI
jgi:hypothetical protein